MKQSLRKIAYCLPVLVVLLVTVFFAVPSAQAAGLKTPVLNAPVSTVSGVKMSWNKVPGAAKYRVYVKTGSSSWRKLADTANTYFLHKNTASGTTYAYTVRCISKDGKQVLSGFNLIGKKVTYIKAPVISVLTNTAKGPSLTWGAVKGAARYRVFVKTGSSAWKRLTDTAARSYVHQNAVPGTKYTYTVRCLSLDGKRFISDFSTSGKAITYITPPKLTLSNDAGGIRVSWNRPSGAARFRVMLYHNGAWAKLSDTSDTSYLYPASTSNKAYTFTVRCLSAASNTFTSVAADKQTITYCAAPRITSATNESDGTRITWNAVNGAKKYRVMLYENDAWRTLTQTDALSYTHDTEHGVYYTYAVCCLDERDNVISGFYADGYTHQYMIPADLDTPVISGHENLDTGLLLKWSPVSGAERYRVMISENGRWSILGETTAAEFLDTAVMSGVERTYTVCCVTADSKTYTSAYDTAGTAFVYYAAPRLTAANTSAGLLLSIDPSDHAAGYRLFIKKGSLWKELDDTAENTYLYSPAVRGTEYRFTACCIDEDGQPVSTYNDAGVSLSYQPNPDQRVFTKAQFSADVCRALNQSAVIPADPNAVLNRRSASEILCDILGYSYHTKDISFIDSESDALKTTVFFGYFYSNESDRIYPEAQITDVEYNALLTEVGRYHQLKGKKALAFGDSIMYGYGNNGYGSCRIICEKYGMQFINYSYCGATMSTCNNGRVHIPDRIKAAHDAGYTADIIFLNGGTNDLTLIRKGQTPDAFDPAAPQNSTFSQGLDYAMMLIRYYWGNTPVLYTRNHNMVVSTEELEQQLGEYGLLIANKYYAHTVDIYADTGLDTEIPQQRDRYTMYRSDLGRSDGIHPNYLGYTTYYLPLETNAILSILLP